MNKKLPSLLLAASLGLALSNPISADVIINNSPSAITFQGQKIELSADKTVALPVNIGKTLMDGVFCGVPSDLDSAKFTLLQAHEMIGGNHLLLINVETKKGATRYSADETYAATYDSKWKLIDAMLTSSFYDTDLLDVMMRMTDVYVSFYGERDAALNVSGDTLLVKRQFHNEHASAMNGGGFTQNVNATVVSPYLIDDNGIFHPQEVQMWGKEMYYNGSRFVKDENGEMVFNGTIKDVKPSYNSVGLDVLNMKSLPKSTKDIYAIWDEKVPEMKVLIETEKDSPMRGLVVAANNWFSWCTPAQLRDLPQYMTWLYENRDTSNLLPYFIMDVNSDSNLKAFALESLSKMKNKKAKKYWSKQLK